MPRVRPRSMFLQDPDGDNVSEMVVMVKHVSGREPALAISWENFCVRIAPLCPV